MEDLPREGGIGLHALHLKLENEIGASGDVGGLPDLRSRGELAGEGVGELRTADKRHQDMDRDGNAEHGRADDRDVGGDDLVGPQPAQPAQHGALREPDPLCQDAGRRLVVALHLLEQGAVEAIDIGHFHHGIPVAGENSREALKNAN